MKRMRRTATAVAAVALVAWMAAQAWAADPAPAPGATILAPTEGQSLEGKVLVRVAVTTSQPASAVYAGMDGAPWLRLERVGESNEWQGTLDSSQRPNGAAKVSVMANAPGAKKLQASVGVKVQNGSSVYFSDLHGHTYYSDGTLLPVDAHRYARQNARLDFFVLMDHLESMDPAEWLDAREQSWKANEEGVFVTYPGLEWTKGVGHACIFDPPTTQWPKDIDGFYQAMADAGCVGKFNHPGDGTKAWAGLKYSEIGDRAMELMEVRNPTEEQAYIRALKLGWHLGPDGSSDTHSPNWGNCNTWTAVVAPGLSRRNMMDALRNRHVYSTHDRNCELYFWINGRLMGDIIEEPAQSVQAEILAIDPEEADTIAKIDLYEDGTVVQTDEPKVAQRRWITTVNAAPGPHFYFVKVTQTDGNTMYSAPVWVTRTELPN
jgi:predicted metal-dependent phosphoesterase TrpH